MSNLPTTVRGIDLQQAIDLRQKSDPARDRAQVETLAHEFEAMLMLQMIREMRKSMLDESSTDAGLGGETMRDTFDVELSRHLAQAGGLGLGALLSGQMSGGAPASGAGGTAGVGALAPVSSERPLYAPAATMPLVAPVKMLDVSEFRRTPTDGGRSADIPTDTSRLNLPIEGTTTSAFGWRADPVTGRTRLHRGVDLRAAYGTDVPAAQAGEVVFAGQRGAYGNLVIVRHDGGVETRYAHLASIAVKPGVAVAAGESLGRVGSSGRSTAPHLHFEVLVNGERVDPERIARAGSGPLKSGSLADD